MTYTTKAGKEIQVNPILLSDREGWVKCRALQRICGEFEQIDDSGSDEWWNKREGMHESFQGLLTHLGVNGKDAISEGDIVPIVSLLQTGELPESFTSAGE